MKYLLPEIHVALRIFSMVVVWSSNVQILYKKFALARDFYENIQSAWKSAHWKGIVKETMDTFWRSVKIWQKAECKKKLTFQGHFESLRPMSVFPSKWVCNTLNCHLLVWPIYQTLMMKIIINLVDRPSKSTETNSLQKCDHCTQICHLLVWPLYQAQWWKF